MKAVQEEIKNNVASLLTSDYFKKSVNDVVDIDTKIDQVRKELQTEIETMPASGGSDNIINDKSMILDLVAEQVGVQLRKNLEAGDVKETIQALVADKQSGDALSGGISAQDVALIVKAELEAFKESISSDGFEMSKSSDESDILPFGYGAGGAPALRSGPPMRTASAPVSGGSKEISEIVRIEIEKRVKEIVPSTQAGGGDLSTEKMKAALVPIIPDLLTSDQAQSIIVSTVTMQAIQPGALGDLTGLRSWLQQEILKAAQTLQGS